MQQNDGVTLRSNTIAAAAALILRKKATRQKLWENGTCHISKATFLNNRSCAPVIFLPPKGEAIIYLLLNAHNEPTPIEPLMRDITNSRLLGC